MEFHKPVLLTEVLENLNITAGGKYIDATLGDGGHTLEILKHGGVVFGIDYSEASLARAQKRIEAAGLAANFKGVLGNFKNIDSLVGTKVNGILYDLGYSSSQLDSEAGLSFSSEQPLDMRLDKTLGVTAADLVNSLREDELARLIFELSDEHFSKRIARAIVSARTLKKFQNTRQLADVIASAVSPGYEHGRIHPATRTFQALRIVVNDEIDNLKVSLPRAASLLLPGGRMEVITFHSLEDKVVKNFGREMQPNNIAFGRLVPVMKKPIVPTAEEIAANTRSRSAKLRIFEKSL